MHITRKKTRQIQAGSVKIGGDAPISVQSMCSTDTRDVKATVEQIRQLETAGCELIRVAVPDEAAADALPKPQYPPDLDADSQLDPTGWSCLIGSCSKSPVIAFTLGGLVDTSNAEYWMLSASFGAKEGEDRLVVTPGGMVAGSLQEFVDTANAAWGPGCTFAIVGCVNYRGERAPAQP